MRETRLEKRFVLFISAVENRVKISWKSARFVEGNTLNFNTSKNYLLELFTEGERKAFDNSVFHRRNGHLDEMTFVRIYESVNADHAFAILFVLFAETCSCFFVRSFVRSFFPFVSSFRRSDFASVVPFL